MLVGQTLFATDLGGETERSIRAEKILAHKKSRITKRFIVNGPLADKSTRVIIKLKPSTVYT